MKVSTEKNTNVTIEFSTAARTVTLCCRTQDGDIDFEEFCQVLKAAEDFKTSKLWLKAQAAIGKEIDELTRVPSATKKLKM